MFQFTQEPSSGSRSQCLAKITSRFPLCLLYVSCQCYGGIFRMLQKVNSGNARIDKHSGTINVILARH